MRQRGYNVMDVEPAPKQLDPANHTAFGFGMYSARYGNIYTVRQLLQLAQEAISDTPPQDYIWEKDGRYYDAIRPNIEPSGLDTPEDVAELRQHHRAQVRDMFKNMDVFVFTMGLTEAWMHKKHGTVYPTAPGTICGTFDPEVYEFHNFTYQEIQNDFLSFLKIVNEFRGSRFKVILTVSPVPLTATASDTHILRASTYSKSVLRAVAGQLNERPNIDYFPSYEIVTNPASRGVFFASNLRSVTIEGVDVVMKTFFAEHTLSKARPARTQQPQPSKKASPAEPESSKDDVQCEEAMLEAFSR